MGRLVLGIGFGTTIYAQENGHTITSFTPVNGLASSDVTALYQDSSNYLWIAHAVGISRYDGRYENHLFSGDTRLGKTFCITEYEKGKYLIGAEAGLFFFNDGKLKHIRFKQKTLPVYAIQKNSTNDLWIGTSDGPALLTAAKLNEAINTGEVLLADLISAAWQQHFPLTNTCDRIYITENGAVYLSDGISVYLLTGDSLATLWKGNARDGVTGMASTSKDSIYFSSASSGLHCMENSTHTTIGQRLGNGNNVITHNGQLYYYASTGVYRLDTGINRLRPVVLLDSNFQEWGSCFLIDTENNFWIGTHEKLLQARAKLFTSIVNPSPEGLGEVYSVRQLKNGEMLFGARGGQLFKKAAGRNAFSFERSIFSKAAVYDIMEDQAGDIWFGSGFQGLAHYTKGKMEVYTKQQGLRDNTNLFFLYTKSGEIFTGGDNGVTRIIKSADKINFKNYFFRTRSNHYLTFHTGVEKPGGRLLFGSNAGLFELRDDSLQPVHIAGAKRQNPFVTDIHSDSQGLAWISTMGDGILICSYEGNGTIKLQHQLTETSGLASMIYLDVMVDRDGILWAISHSGISRIEMNDTGEFFISNFDKTHGYINDNYHSAEALQDDAGIIWIATSSGIFSFNPDDALKYLRIPSIQLTKISPEGSQLSHNANSVYFEFSSIHLTDPSTVEYMYRLKGADSNWVHAGGNRSVDFRNLAPGNYSFEVKASSGSNLWSSPAIYNFRIAPPFWTKWWFIASSVIVAIFVLLVVVGRREKNIRNREAAKTEIEKLKANHLEKEIEVFKLNQDLATSQLTALRSQMNPHFIFNSLNSIAHLVASKQNEDGLEYLSKFSRLLRLVLDFSGNDFICLKDEIKVLQLYLQLESLRFDGSFSYNIQVDGQLNEEELMMPSFLIHPAVENAIWHGLLHKQGDRRLIITFKKKSDALLCVVKDNGIGIGAAASGKKNKINDETNTSKGLQLITGRLALLQQQYGIDSYLHLEDMKDESGFVSGTKVTIQLPAIYE